MGRKARKLRSRKHRRLSAARIRTGKVVSRHRLTAGRTGQVHHKKLQSLKPK